MKKIYFLLGTALLLCCLFNFNAVRAQDAVATWPLTEAAGGVATTSGEISAADERLNSMVIKDYSGTNGSQRVQIDGVVDDQVEGKPNVWPNEQTDTIPGVYVEFAIAPNVGHTLNATSISYDISSGGTDNMSARVFYSTDPTFKTVTEIEGGSGDANYNVPRDKDDADAPLPMVSVSETISATVASGETLYLRIYPWFNNSAAGEHQDGKYIYLQNVVISGTTSEGTACTPTAITPQIEVVDVMAWTATDQVTVDPGVTVNVGPWPTDGQEGGGGDWSWTGPDNFSHAERGFTLENIQSAQSGVYSVTYTNPSGCVSTDEVTITVNGTDPGTDPGAKTIVFVAKPIAEGAPETKDDAQIQWLKDQGFTVETFFKAGLSATTDAADIQMLNDADLIIVGRSGGSGDFPKDVWNAITTPVILNQQWAARSDKMGWFDFTDGLTHHDVTDEVIVADVLVPDDEVFSGVTLGENNTLPWSNAPEDFLLTPATITNGTVLASVASGSAVGAETYLFVRFEAGEAFYEGGTTPADQRTYFGFGNDHTNDESGADFINFWNLTDQAKTVYLAEINRLLETETDPGTGGPKDVAYFTSNKEMAEGAVDAVRAMLEADENINLTVFELADDAVVEDDLTQFDAIVIQEGFNSGAAILKPDGSLALADIPVPFLYNKTYALREDRAITTSGSASAEGAGLGITVEEANQSNALFEGITFDENNTFTVFNKTTEDNGTIDTEGATKALNYTSGINPFPENTLLGSPSETTFDAPNSTVFLNFVPAGSTIGSETTEANAYFFGMNYGAISADGGENMTEAGLQLWRNAVYELAGVGEGPALAQASNPTPANDATEIGAADLTLTWEGNAETYNVHWGTAENELTLAGEALAEASFAPENVVEGTEYFWRVDAISGDETVEGIVWSFTTAGEAPDPTDATAEITVNGTPIAFDENGTFTQDLPAGTMEVEVNVTPTSPLATAEGGGTVTLEEGENTVTVVVTAEDGTTTETYTLIFNVAPATGIADLASQGVRIFPNPVNGSQVLTLDGAADIVSVNVYNAQGILLKVVNANSSNISINVADLAKGLYILKAVKNDRTVLSGKFVK